MWDFVVTDYSSGSFAVSASCHLLVMASSARNRLLVYDLFEFSLQQAPVLRRSCVFDDDDTPYFSEFEDMVFLAKEDAIVVATDSYKHAVHVVNVAEGRHIGFVSPPHGDIGKPLGIASCLVDGVIHRVAVSSFCFGSCSCVHVFDCVDGDIGSWSSMFCVFVNEGFIPTGVQFGIGKNIVVAHDHRMAHICDYVKGKSLATWCPYDGVGDAILDADDRCLHNFEKLTFKGLKQVHKLVWVPSYGVLVRCFDYKFSLLQSSAQTRMLHMSPERVGWMHAVFYSIHQCTSVHTVQ